MTVNRGGNLNEAYFISYLKLIMASRQCNAECAEKFAFEKFFSGDAEKFGPATFEHFKKAVASLK